MTEIYKVQAAPSLGAIMYSLGQIAGTVWPTANIPCGIQTALLSRPRRGLGLMMEHEDFDQLPPLDALMDLLFKVVDQLAGVDPTRVSDEQAVRFWMGFLDSHKICSD